MIVCSSAIASFAKAALCFLLCYVSAEKGDVALVYEQNEVSHHLLIAARSKCKVEVVRTTREDWHEKF
jgi:hypothetical protein